MNSGKIRIVIVDDQPLFRQSLRRLLENQHDFSVVAEAGNGIDGISSVEEHNPDVVLMDISMPKMDGLQATRIIVSRYPGMRVIVLSMHSDDTMKAISCQAGACYYLCKDCTPKEIIASIRDGHNPG